MMLRSLFCSTNWRSLAAALLALVFGCALAKADVLRITSYKATQSNSQTQVEMDLSANANFTWFLLKSPYRIAIDLPQASFAFDAKALRAAGLVSSVRYGAAGAGRSRLMLTATKPFEVRDASIKPGPVTGRYRLSLTLAQSSTAEFDKALAAQAVQTASVQPAESTATEHPFTVILDPGHGGIDSGAVGLDGTMEKQVTLGFAQALRTQLAAKPGIKVVLTRDDDRFIKLDDRVEIARRNGANLFISIHADTIHEKSVRGTTVYTVSDEASDAAAAALAERENLADQIAGFHIESDNKQIADVLLDLTRRETHRYSVNFAKGVVSRLRDITGMIKNPHRYAGFRVLKAPDVPSVLIELGYLSNPKDEELLLSDMWRQKAAQSMADAIADFAKTAVATRN